MLRSDTAPLSLAMSQVKQGASVLARAFQHDPMMKYLVADDAAMLTSPARVYRASIRMGRLYGEVHTTRSIEGVAVWVSP